MSPPPVRTARFRPSSIAALPIAQPTPRTHRPAPSIASTSGSSTALGVPGSYPRDPPYDPTPPPIRAAPLLSSSRYPQYPVVSQLPAKQEPESRPIYPSLSQTQNYSQSSDNHVGPAAARPARSPPLRTPTVEVLVAKEEQVPKKEEAPVPLNIGTSGRGSDQVVLTDSQKLIHLRLQKRPAHNPTCRFTDLAGSLDYEDVSDLILLSE